MGKIILISGASSGFGALTARALADEGHTVYAGMRGTSGHNAAAVSDAQAYAKRTASICEPSRWTCPRRTRWTPP
ncbi:hypothetical protein [Deinococcus sp.]|uniref:hypothetical protein n=1 Tax=Deinococcus sp. TaxID=47478 RepID=UPI003B58ED5D